MNKMNPMKRKIALLLSILVSLSLSAQEKEQYQLINKNGEIVTPIYEFIGSFFTDGSSFSFNGKTGLLNSLGNIILPPTFEKGIAFAAFQNPDLRLNFPRDNNKYALMNSRHQLVTPFLYDKKRGLTHDRIAVQKGEYWAVIDTLGNELTPFIYDYEIEYQAGFILVQKDNKTGLIYRNGKQIIPFTEDQLTFTKGLWQGLSNRELGLTTLVKNNRLGVIDSTGKEILPFIYESIRRSDVDLLYLVKKAETFDNKAEVGVIDLRGNIILEPIYEKMDIFDKGVIAMKDGKYFFFDHQGNQKFTSDKKIGQSTYACFSISGDPAPQFYDCQGNHLSHIEKDPSRPETDYWWIFEDEKTGFDGYWDISTGAIVIPAQYDDLSYAQDTPRWLRIVTHKGKKGILDSNNKILLPIQYKDIETLDDDRCALYKGKKIAISDYEGNLLTPFEFDYITTYNYSVNSQKIHPYTLYGVIKNKHCGIFTCDSKELVPCIYDYTIDDNYNYTLFDVLDNGRIKMMKNGKSGFIDEQTGQVLLSFDYEYLEEKKLDYIQTKKNKKYGLVDINGKEILACDYNDIKVLENGAIILQVEGQYGVADKNGKIVIPIKYKEIKVYHGDILVTVK